MQINIVRISILVLMVSFLVPVSVDAATSRRSSGWSGGWGGGEGRMSSSVQKKINNLDDDIVEEFVVPILLGVAPRNVSDTWGDARSNGREHEGTDIFAPRGAFVVSPTKAVVSSIGKAELGGNYVYTSNPGGERFYYAHLDDYADGLSVGDELDIGDLIGYVGDSGNAQGGTPHLHFGIYKRGAQNPYERLTKEFTLKQRIEALDTIITTADDEDELAAELLASYRALFIQAEAEDIDLPKEVQKILDAEREAIKSQATMIDLTLGSQGDAVVWLQEYLITQNIGSAAAALTTSGATGYFGALTKAALVEYQIAKGITPATGYFGPLTRATIK